MLVKGVHVTEEGDVVIPVIGIPFRGPKGGNADLIGDVFDKNTDFGPAEVDTVYSYFDHGMSVDYIADEYEELYGEAPDSQTLNRLKSAFGREPIGYAKRIEETDEGILYNIVVSRRHKYKELLRRLAEEGMLDASSKAVERINDPQNPNRIKGWHIGAIDLTPSPMNPEAKALIKSIMEAQQMGDETKTQKAVADEAQTQVVEPTDAGADEATPQASESSTPLTDAIQAAFSTGDEETIIGTVKSVETRLAEMEATMEALTKSIPDILTQIQSTTKSVDNLQGDLAIALPQLAQMIAKSLGGKLTIEKQKSARELEVENAHRKATTTNNVPNGRGSGPFPSHWGGN